MNKSPFLNKIQASFDPAFGSDLDQYFADSRGSYDDDTAQEYIRYFTHNPRDLSVHAAQGLSRQQSLIASDFLNINSPIRP